MNNSATKEKQPSLAGRMGKAVFSSDKIGLIIALIVIVAVFQVLTKGTYISLSNFRNILISSAIVGMAMIGETFLMITGGIDLSPGSVAAFSGVLVALLLTWNVPLPLAILITVAVGAIGGYLNSLLINKLHFIPFIATLAAMSVFRGAAFIICDGKAVFVNNSAFLAIGSKRILGIPVPAIIFLVFFLLFWVVLSRTRFGRNVYMVGGNENAARLAGIDAARVRTVLYMISAALAALGGCLMAARMSSGQPSACEGLEFDAVTAAVLGGVAMNGGVGTMGGALIGLMILQGFNNGLMMMNVPSFWQTVSRGLLLIAALAFDFIRTRRKAKKAC